MYLSFSLAFLANASFDNFISCSKDELVQIAAYFGFGHPRQIFKRDLQGLVLCDLVEQKLVMLPAQAEPSELLGTLGEKGSCKQEGEPPARR